MTGRKPRRSEINAARASRAAVLAEWLTARRERRDEQVKRDNKARLLAGGTGGSGVTIEMRRISAEANVDNPPTLNPGGYIGPNRAERRADARRSGRGWQNRVRASQNVPYVAPRDTRRSDRA